jgi:hypothetical protein
MGDLRRTWRSLSIALFLTTGASGTFAQELPPQQPQLVIDAGMHTARIQRIGVDAAWTSFLGQNQTLAGPASGVCFALKRGSNRDGTLLSG